MEDFTRGNVMRDFKIGRCFSILHRRSQQFIVAACAPLSLSYPECVLLLAVFEEQGKSQDELADVLFLDKAVVTRTITLLEHKKFLYREHDSKDRRIKRIFLTEEARRHEKFLKEVFSRWTNYLFAGFSEKDLTSLEIGLSTLADRAKMYNVH